MPKRKCIWCGGETLICALCDRKISCMFCGGSGEFTPIQKFPAHQCNREEPVGDNLSAKHYKAVWAEIQGRFFSEEEAEKLKADIDRKIITNPEIRAEAAKCWNGGNE
jgi:hypothetical protein